MLQFATHEKNLFGQVRSWSAASGDGCYIIERGAAQEQFQARYQPRTGRPVLLQQGRWIASFARAQSLCDADAQARLRQRMVERSRRR